MVEVCEPITIQLKFLLPLEQLRKYLMITPFGFIGASHERINDEEVDITDRL